MFCSFLPKLEADLALLTRVWPLNIRTKSDSTVFAAFCAISSILFSAKMNWMMFQPTSKVTRTPRNEMIRFESLNPQMLLIRAKIATIRATSDRYIDFITLKF